MHDGGYEVTAIILTGGKSRRMGLNKAFLKYGDTTFIEHQIMMLRKIFDEIILCGWKKPKDGLE